MGGNMVSVGLKEDRLMVVMTLSLVAFGLVMVYSASSVLALQRFGDPSYFFKRQALWAAIGIAAMFVMGKIDYRALRRYAPPMLALSFLLLLLVLVPGIGGGEVNGAMRWIRIGGLSFQPSELMKPVLLVAVSASLAKRREKLGDFVHGLGPYLALTGMVMLVIMFEPDLGTAAALGASVVCVLFFAGARTAHLGLLGVMAAPVLYVQLFKVGFRKGRLLAYLDPWSDPLGRGFQIIQSFLAFGGGGLTGRGLGESRQKLLFLPEPHSDFIFSVIGEELGLVAALAVVGAFMFLLFMGIRVALRCDDEFGRFLAFGISALLGIESLVNMGVATGLFPNKGMPLPFVSAGGSALLVSLICMGILISISRSGDVYGGRRTGSSMAGSGH